MTIQYLRTGDLAKRWCMSVKTFERWRWEGRGPRYLKVNGRVLYRLDDIEAYEAENTIDLEPLKQQGVNISKLREGL
jgi:hypothetical protein